MKTLLKVSLFAVASFTLAGCAPPANTNTNTNANTNANIAAKPAAPTAESLIAMDNKAWEAYKNRDTKFFEGLMADNFVSFENGKRVPRAESIKMIGEHKCDIKSFSLSEPHVTSAGADAAVVTYKGTLEGTCEGQKMPAAVTAATVYVRSGDTWKAAYHGEVPIVEPKGDAAANSSDKAAPVPPPAAEKKEAPAANTTAANSNATASNSNTASSGDALTDALMAVERKGWESWMKQDAAGLQSTTAKDMTFVDAMGKVTKGQAEAVKMWTNGSCKVSSVAVTDGTGTMISKDAAILTYKGTAVGTCDGMKLAPLYGMTVAVKEGETWKAVYLFEMPIN